MTRGEVVLVAIFSVSLCCRAQGVKSEAEGQTAPVPASTPLDAATTPATSPDSYVIGATDVLNVTVWKETGLSGEFLVRPDGMISIPLIGDLRASGSTPHQLARDIEGRLKKFIQSPNVTVEIKQIHSKVVYLLGEVSRKGPIDLSPGMTLLQAISSAGGLTDYANAKKIYILRTSSGKQEKIPVRYKEALKGVGALNLVLQPGDTIVVP